MKRQIRIYTVKTDSMEQWVYIWKTQVKPLRKKMGFTIEKAWKTHDNKYFIWILSHRGPGNWEIYDKAYYESDERRSLSPDPYRFIQSIQNEFIDHL